MAFWARIGPAGSFGALLVGGCGARAVSRKTRPFLLCTGPHSGACKESRPQPTSQIDVVTVIIGFRQWGVRKGQNMAQTWPRLYIYTKLLALKPSRGP